MTLLFYFPKRKRKAELPAAMSCLPDTSLHSCVLGAEVLRRTRMQDPLLSSPPEVKRTSGKLCNGSSTQPAEIPYKPSYHVPKRNLHTFEQPPTCFSLWLLIIIASTLEIQELHLELLCGSIIAEKFLCPGGICSFKFVSQSVLCLPECW